MEKRIFNNKKSVMCLASLMILFFHLWIAVFRGNDVETFLRKSSYIGVDIFFFVSAYSLASRSITDLKKFYFSRFKSVYLKFAIFTVLAAVLNKWGLLRCIKALCGIELFEKGGAGFLWFLPAIIIFYIVFPLFQRLFAKFPWAGVLTALIIWFAVGLAVSVCTKYTAMFIFWNRIPALVCGGILATCDNFVSTEPGKKYVTIKASVSLVLIIIGIILVGKFGINVKLDKPIHEIFYVTALPLALGLALLADFIPEVLFIRVLGSATLEMYAIQMIWGFDWANRIYKITRSSVATNILIFLSIMILSICASEAYKVLLNLFKKKTN